MYPVFRDRIIDFLRLKGALLLDTEHIESTFNLALPPRRFLAALGTFGTPVEYETDSIRDFPGVSVLSPVVEGRDKLEAVLPAGTELGAMEPMKVRIVRRGARGFAFIPIWYPPIQEAAFRDDRWQSAPAYLRRALDKCPDKRLPELSFHLASVVCIIRARPLCESGEVRPVRTV